MLEIPRRSRLLGILGVHDNVEIMRLNQTNLIFFKSKMSKRSQKKSTKRSNKSSERNTQLWVARGPVSNNSFLPRKIINHLRTVATGQVNAVMAANFFSWVVNASSIYQPFNSTSKPLNGGYFTYTTGYSVTENPLGYGELSQLYAFYKVIKATLKVTMIPAASVDTSIVAACPSAVENGALDVFEIEGYPKGKSLIANSGATAMMTRFSVSCSAREALGYSQIQFEGLPPTAVGSPPNDPGQWFFNQAFQTVNNATPTAAIFLRIELIQDVEWSELVEFTT